MTRSLLTVLAMMTLATAALPDEPPMSHSDRDLLWFESVARAESRFIASRRDTLVATDRDPVLEQIRHGTASVRAAALAAVPSDSLRAGPLTPPPIPWRRPGQWGNRIVKASSIIAVTLSLAGIAASVRDASERTRSTLALTAGAVGGMGALFNLLRPRPAPPPAVDPNERMRTMIREMYLHDTFTEIGKALREVAAEMEAIRATPVTADSAMVMVARRYTGALERAEALFDVQVPHAANVAREASAYSGFSTTARGRLGVLADHVDDTSQAWRARRWLVERSGRVVLEWLVIVDGK